MADRLPCLCVCSFVGVSVFYAPLQVPSVSVSWGGVTVVERTLALMQRATEVDSSWRFFVNLGHVSDGAGISHVVSVPGLFLVTTVAAAAGKLVVGGRWSVTETKHPGHTVGGWVYTRVVYRRDFGFGFPFNAVALL